MKYALFSIAINTVLSIALFFQIGYLGVAVATSFAAWLNAGLLAARLYAREQLQLTARLTSRALRIMLAATGMGVGLYFLINSSDFIPRIIGEQQWLALALYVFAGLIAYGALCLALGALRPSELRTLLRRR